MKGVENPVVDHLSRIQFTNMQECQQITSYGTTCC